jgi:hypothetical protein
VASGIEIGSSRRVRGKATRSGLAVSRRAPRGEPRPRGAPTWRPAGGGSDASQSSAGLDCSRACLSRSIMLGCPWKPSHFRVRSRNLSPMLNHLREQDTGSTTGGRCHAGWDASSARSRARLSLISDVVEYSASGTYSLIVSAQIDRVTSALDGTSMPWGHNSEPMLKSFSSRSAGESHPAPQSRQ